MPNDNQTEEVVLSEENNTEVSENTEEVTETTEPEVDYRGKLNATNSFLKKEGYEFKNGKWVKDKIPTVQTEPKLDVSYRDGVALMRANVSEEDMDEVIDFARFKNISVSEALKTTAIKSILKEKEEQRKTALATNTGTARRSSTKLSDEEIVERASRGEFPEDPTVLARAESNLKRKK